MFCGVVKYAMFVDYLSACSDDTDLYFSDKGDSISAIGSSIMRDMTDDQVRNLLFQKHSFMTCTVGCK